MKSFALLLTATLALTTLQSFALRKNETWNKQTKAPSDAEAGGWFINLGITGARARILLDRPQEFEISYVFPNTPAHKKLQPGDRILGVNGTAFTEPHKFGYGPTFSATKVP